METIAFKDYSIDLSNDFAEQQYFHDCISEKNYSKIIILVDESTEQLCLPLIHNYLKQYDIISIPPGEHYKNISTCTHIWERMTELGADRKSLLLNLGGGVIGDMGGFAASTYKRGFDFINLPTTLLAQVDASVGGKLAIDLRGIKNIIGLFRDPKHIFISSQFLGTLPFDQLRSGFAEVLKHGLILDREYWDEIKSIKLREYSNWLPVIKHSVELKKYVVDKDPYEAGLRKILNFGHTIGHAIETVSLQTDAVPLLHGEAIAIGMICEAWLSREIYGLGNKDMDELINSVLQYFPKHDISNFDPAALIRLMKLDKKNTGETISFSLLSEIGNCGYDLKADAVQIEESLKFYTGL